jgi:hypothetical protein
VKRIKTPTTKKERRESKNLDIREYERCMPEEIPEYRERECKRKESGGEI